MYPVKKLAHHNEEELNILEVLKTSISTPVLTLFRRKAQITLDTNACDRQVGSVLSQKIEGSSHRTFR